MITQKGHSFTNLISLTVNPAALLPTFTMELPTRDNNGDVFVYPDGVNFDASLMVAMQKGVDNYVEEEMHGHQKMESLLGRIEMHRTLLIQAYLELWNSWDAKVHPRNTGQRKKLDIAAITLNAEQAGMKKVLAAMPDKMLMTQAQVLIGDSALEYLLPDERDNLINEIVVKM